MENTKGKTSHLRDLTATLMVQDLTSLFSQKRCGYQMLLDVIG